MQWQLETDALAKTDFRVACCHTPLALVWGIVYVCEFPLQTFQLESASFITFSLLEPKLVAVGQAVQLSPLAE